jgi:hypothetical protein
VYVYGVVRAGALRSLPGEGVAGAGVELIEHHGLSAVVSELPGERLRIRRRDLLRHLQVLEAGFSQTTIVPCSFGSVLETRALVADQLLIARHQELLELLEHLQDRVQLNVTAVYDEPEVLREVVAAEPEIARLRERTRALGSAGYYENIRLGELVAAAVSVRRDSDSRRILDRVAAEAEDVVAEADEAVVVKASFLVARDRLERFDAKLDALAREEQPRIRFECVGPLPPTAFASLRAAA